MKNNRKLLTLCLLFALLGIYLIVHAQPNCALTSMRCVGSGQEYSTIQAAADDAVAGDTVYVFNGSYAGFKLVAPHVSGTLSQPILIQAQSPSVIITSQGDSSGDWIDVDTVDHVIIDGFTVPNATRVGIRCAISDGTIFRNNVVTGATQQGILTGFCINVQILSNMTSGTIQQHGIYVSNSDTGFDGPIVKYNISHDNALAGIQFNGDCGSLGPHGTTDGMIDGAFVEGNTLYNNGGDGFSLINISSSTIRNNLLYNNTGGAGGIKFADQGCNLGSNSNVISNNTIYGTFAAIRIVSGSSNTFWNNITVSNGFYCVIDATTTPCDNSGSGGTGNNYLPGLERTVAAAASGVFTNVSTHDFTLASGSPALDIGVTTNGSYNSPKVDLLFNLRPANVSWDVGSYERLASPAPPDTTPPTTPGTPSPTLSAYSAILSWAPSTDNLEVIGYIVYRNGSPYASALFPLFTDLAVTPGATYTYDIYAYDGSGNISTNSTVTVTVLGEVGCMNADTSFRSYIIPQQTGIFSFDWESTPFGSGTTNGVVSLSTLAATDFTQMAAIVRFPSSGNIDARNGSVYTADVTLPYTIGVHYAVHFDVDIVAQTYNVIITPAGGMAVALATGYSFRTETLGLTLLSYLNTNDSTGSISVCAPVLNGIPVIGTTYLQKSQQDLATQVISTSLIDANGTGKPLLDTVKLVPVSGSRALALSDNAAMLVYAGSSDITITASSALPSGFGCAFFQSGTGHITLSGSGLTLLPTTGPNKTRVTGSMAGVQCATSGTCTRFGDLR